MTSPPDLRETIEIRDVGTFTFVWLAEPEDKPLAYIQTRPEAAEDQEVHIALYPESDVLSEDYEDRVRAVVAKVELGLREMLVAAEDKIRALANDHDRKLPEAFEEFVDVLRLTWVHIERNGDAELVFLHEDDVEGTDFIAQLDGQCAIESVRFYE